jgi:sortase A
MSVVKSKKPSKKIKQSSGLENAIAYGLITLGIIGVVASLIIYKDQPKEPAAAKDVKSVNVAQAPSSIKPATKAVALYSVAPNLPKYISIPAIGIPNTEVIKLGLMSNGEIATPDNIFQTGWYDGSSQPGQPGAMFIYGHVSSWTSNGIFYNLKQLKAGDKIVITTGNNTVYTYQVVNSKVYGYTSVPMNTVLAPVSSDKPGLNLMTCTGSVIKGTSEFNERLVVYTSLVST